MHSSTKGISPTTWTIGYITDDVPFNTQISQYFLFAFVHAILVCEAAKMNLPFVNVLRHWIRIPVRVLSNWD